MRHRGTAFTGDSNRRNDDPAALPDFPLFLQPPNLLIFSPRTNFTDLIGMSYLVNTIDEWGKNNFKKPRERERGRKKTITTMFQIQYKCIIHQLDK